MTRGNGHSVSAFWGSFGGDHQEQAGERQTLFGHQIHRVKGSWLTCFYTSPPTMRATDIPEAPLHYLFAGRPFFLDPAAMELQDRPASEFLGNIDGKFRVLMVRGDGGTILLATDIIGAGALYYTVSRGQLFFGTHLGPLLDLLPRRPPLNRLGVVSLLLSYGQLFEETHFSGVRRLQAGQFLEAVWNPQQAKVEVHVGQYCEPEEVLLRGAPVPADPRVFGDLLRASQVREGYDESTALMLSGGKDSKALALTKPPILKTAISYGMRDSFDRRRGRRLARKLLMTHYNVPYDAWNFDTYAELIVGLNGGCSGLQTSYNVAGFDWASKLCHRSVTGFLGDALTGGHLGRDDKIDAARVEATLLVGPRRLVGEAFPVEAEAVKERVAAVFAAYRALTPAQALLIMDLRFRQATWISMTFDLCGWAAPVSHPFFYRPLMQTLFQAPVGELMGQHFYVRWLADEERKQGTEVTRVDMLWESVMSRYYRLRNGRGPVEVVCWPEVIKRTPGLTERRHMGVMEELDRLTQPSLREATQETADILPFGLISASIAAACR
jgi:hypothetical protein